MIKKSIHCLLFFFLVCLSSKAMGQTVIFLKVEGATKASLPELDQVIRNRFENIKKGYFTSVSTALRNHEIAVSFVGWMPSAQQINYLITAQGQFEVYLISEDTQLLISQQDVIDAEGMISQGLPSLGVRVSDKVAKSLFEKTKQAAGQQVELRWDGGVHSRMMIGGPLSAFSTLTVASAEEAALMAAVLKAGSLPTGVILTVVQK